MNAVLQVLLAVLNAVRYLLTQLFDIIKNVFLWVWEFCLARLNDALQALELPTIDLSELGTSLKTGPIFDALIQANYWLPLYEGLYLLAAYVTLLAAAVPVKFILRHLPYVGG